MVRFRGEQGVMIERTSLRLAREIRDDGAWDRCRRVERVPRTCPWPRFAASACKGESVSQMLKSGTGDGGTWTCCRRVIWCRGPILGEDPRQAQAKARVVFESTSQMLAREGDGDRAWTRYRRRGARGLSLVKVRRAHAGASVVQSKRAPKVLPRESGDDSTRTRCRRMVPRTYPGRRSAASASRGESGVREETAFQVLTKKIRDDSAWTRYRHEE